MEFTLSRTVEAPSFDRYSDAVVSRVTVSSFCYRTALFLYCITYYCGAVNTDFIFGIPIGTTSRVLQGLGAGFLVISIITCYASSKLNLMATILGCAVAGMSLYFTKTTTISWLLLLAIASVGCRHEDTYSTILIAVLSVFILVILLNITGHIKDVTMTRANSMAIRRSMGFAHPNNFGQMVLIAYASYCVLCRNGKHKAQRVVLAILACAIVIYISDSRSAALGIGAMCLLSIVRDAWNLRHLRVSLQKLCEFMIVACAVVSVALLLMYMCGNQLALRIDSLITGRIYYEAYFWERYFPSLFGVAFSNAQTLLSSTGTYYIDAPVIIDNSYIRLFVQYGIVPAAVIIVLTLVGIHRCDEYQYVMPLFGLIVYGVIGLFENGLIYAPIDFFIVPILGLAYAERKSLHNSAFDRNLT